MQFSLIIMHVLCVICAAQSSNLKISQMCIRVTS